MLRYCLLVPLALLVASVVAGWRSYANAREDIADDLNEAMIALANENRNLWIRQDTVAALRTMHETTRKPVIYQASDVNFRNPNLKDKAYIAVALADKYAEMPKINGDKIASDSIILVQKRMETVWQYGCKDLPTVRWRQFFPCRTKGYPVCFSRCRCYR